MNHWAKYYYLEIIKWTFLLNLLVGMFNYLPFAIFDGAKLLEDMINFYDYKLRKKKNKQLSKKMLKATFWIVVITFIINFLPYFIK